jgi:hypothetical protein
MSACEKCEHNTMCGCCSCALCLPQVDTDQGIRSKILGCPEFVASTSLDFAVHDQTGGVL